ncbi:hypothetical protein T07_5320, partial [Trichinella nelsoni]
LELQLNDQHPSEKKTNITVWIWSTLHAQLTPVCELNGIQILHRQVLCRSRMEDLNQMDNGFHHPSMQFVEYGILLMNKEKKPKRIQERGC